MKETHTHHILPKHAGGTDDPSNLVELTVEDHAIAHKVLYGLHGRLEDKMAWLALSGKTTQSEEIRKMLAKRGLHHMLADFSKKTRWQQNIKKARQKQVITQEHRNHIGDGLRKAYADGRKSFHKSDTFDYKQNLLNNKEKLDAGRRNSTKWKEAHKNANIKRSQTLGTNIFLNGIKYNSIREAARLSNFSYTKIRNLVSKFGNVITIP